LHPDGKRIAVPCADGVVRVYDISPKEVPPVPTPKEAGSRGASA
jgi:hypothetical protein